MRVHISPGNQKLGEIPNVSTSPRAACNPAAPCTRSGCYAARALRYPHTRTAWRENLYLAQHERPRFFNVIGRYLQKKQPRFFRWHVAGDILDADYLQRMHHTAQENPNTLFLAFTKRHELSFPRAPENLSIVFSQWPQWQHVTRRRPRAWMQDGTETRIPANALECPGNCENCGFCWNLKKIGRDVFFLKH